MPNGTPFAAAASAMGWPARRSSNSGSCQGNTPHASIQSMELRSLTHKVSVVLSCLRVASQFTPPLPWTRTLLHPCPVARHGARMGPRHAHRRKPAVQNRLLLTPTHLSQTYSARHNQATVVLGCLDDLQHDPGALGQRALPCGVNLNVCRYGPIVPPVLHVVRHL